MLRKKEQTAQLWMIDTECNQNVSSKILLNEAELIVVTLRRELQSIVNFIKNFSEIKEKSIFLITDFKHYKWIRTIESAADLILMKCRKKVGDSNGEEME